MAILGRPKALGTTGSRPMDDEHARRNLLVASALVLLSVWLGSPVGALAKAVLTAEGAAPLSAFRVWAAVLVLLLYLGHRYTHAKQGADALANWIAAIDQWRQHRVRQTLFQIIEDTVKTGRSSPLVEPSKGSAEWLRGMQVAHAPDGTTTLRYAPVPGTLNLKDFSGTIPWTGRLAVDLEGSTSSAQHVSSRQVEAAYTIPGTWQRHRIGALARWDTLMKTGALTDYVVPASMALAACGVAGYRAAAAW
jgi:hypothetical protein